MLHVKYNFTLKLVKMSSDYFKENMLLWHYAAVIVQVLLLICDLFMKSRKSHLQFF